MDENTSLEEIQNNLTSQIKAKSTVRPRNRAERRAFEKKIGKKSKEQFDLISETALKLNYVSLIQKLREINEQKEKENG